MELALFLMQTYLIACFYVIIVFMLTALMWTIVCGVISFIEGIWWDKS